MKKLFVISAAALVLTSTAANAWTDRWGHWHERPTLYGPINPGVVAAPYGYPPTFGAPSPGYFYGPPPPAVYGYGGPVIVAPPPTDAQVIAGTVLGIASMFANGRRW